MGGDRNDWKVRVEMIRDEPFPSTFAMAVT
jgi:hypothetical protein